MIIIIPDWISKTFGGITIYPFIFLKRKYLENKIFINHEKIHLRQQAEILVIPFFAIYLLNYIVNLLIYRNSDKAYRQIIFEREAYQNEKNLDYLK